MRDHTDELRKRVIIMLTQTQSIEDLTVVSITDLKRKQTHLPRNMYIGVFRVTIFITKLITKLVSPWISSWWTVQIKAPTLCPLSASFAAPSFCHPRIYTLAPSFSALLLHRSQSPSFSYTLIQCEIHTPILGFDFPWYEVRSPFFGHCSCFFSAIVPPVSREWCRTGFDLVRGLFRELVAVSGWEVVLEVGLSG